MGAFEVLGLKSTLGDYSDLLDYWKSNFRDAGQSGWQHYQIYLGQVLIPFDCLRCLYSLYEYRHEWFTQPDPSAIGIGQISEIRA